VPPSPTASRKGNVSSFLKRYRGPIGAFFRRAWERLWLAALVVLGCAIYLYFVSAGGLKDWPVYGSYYDRLSDGFLAGHLNIPVAIAPELLAAKNPYDSINSAHWWGDASYYKGKYYIYWGPLPALLQAAAKSLLDIRHAIGDLYVALFFLCLGVLFGAQLVERVARRLFGSVSRPLVALGILTLVLSNPTLHAVTTTGTYHVAIVSAQTCLLGGLVAAFDVVWRSASPGDRRVKLMLAGLGFGLALACRVTVAPAVAIFCVATVLADAWCSERRFSKLLASSVWLGAPLLVISGALLYYNKLRFESWFEFGMTFQTTSVPAFRLSAEYAWPNLYSYMLRPPFLSCQFPYVFQVWVMGADDAFPHNFQLPKDYMILEPVIGWLRAVPITWLIPFGFLLAPRPLSFRERNTRAYLWCLIVFSAFATATGLVGITLYGATMRYLNDITFGLVLVSLLGGYALKVHRLGRRAPRVTTALFSSLAIASIVLGMLIGYQGYNWHFSKHNPALDAVIVKRLSVCDGPAVLPRYHP